MLVNLYLIKTKKNSHRKIVGNSRIFCRFGKNDLKEIVKNGVKVGEKIIQKQENLPALPPPPPSTYQDSRKLFRGVNDQLPKRRDTPWQKPCEGLDNRSFYSPFSRRQQSHTTKRYATRDDEKNWFENFGAVVEKIDDPKNVKATDHFAVRLGNYLWPLTHSKGTSHNQDPHAQRNEIVSGRDTNNIGTDDPIKGCPQRTAKNPDQTLLTKSLTEEELKQMSANSIDRVLKSLKIKVEDPIASTDLQVGLNAVDYSKHVPKSHKSDLIDGFIDGTFSELENKKIKK